MTSGTITGLSSAELDLSATLWSGQAFRFTQDADGVWEGYMERTRRVRLVQSKSGDTVYWEAEGADAAQAVRRFLRLDDFVLAEAAETWCHRDTAFAAAWKKQPGVRILRQDPFECFFSFLCASVAPIQRIRKMVEAIGGTAVFSDLPALSHLTEDELRARGLGFRAVRVVEAIERLNTLPADYLHLLRGQPLAEIRTALTEFHGVGRKIADCIALFSLDKDEAVPVDVHIWRMAQKHYAKSLQGQSLTPANYARAVDGFHQTFGKYAGWAQQTLFYQEAV